MGEDFRMRKKYEREISQNNPPVFSPERSQPEKAGTDDEQNEFLDPLLTSPHILLRC
jgi:hypothetical protein